jgi:hypothetical protein
MRKLEKRILNNMKHIFSFLFLCITTTIFLLLVASCGNNEQDLNKSIQSLQKQYDSMNKKQIEILSNDTTNTVD